MVTCPLALLGSAFYPVLVHRLAASLHASSPPSVALRQLRFASFAVINLRRDFHPQECAHAGRTSKRDGAPSHLVSSLLTAIESSLGRSFFRLSIRFVIFAYRRGGALFDNFDQTIRRIFDHIKYQIESVTQSIIRIRHFVIIEIL